MKKKGIAVVCIAITVLICPFAIEIYKQNSPTFELISEPLEQPYKEVINNIKKQYPGWMEELDIKDWQVIGYEGNVENTEKNNGNQIELNINDSYGDELKMLAEKDYDFIKTHSDVFDKNTKRGFYYSHIDKDSIVKRYGYKNYLDPLCMPLGLDVELDGSMKIGFLLGNARSSKSILDKIEVLEIYRDKKSISVTDDEGIESCIWFFVRHKINDLKYIVLLDFAEGTDKKLEEEIKSIYPDVKIYQVNTKDEEKQ